MGKQAVRRVGAFPDTIDPLICRDGFEDIELLYLVARGSVEEAWAKKFLPRDSMVVFEADGRGKPLALLSLDELVSQSNLGKVLSEQGIQSVIASCVRSPKTEAWARSHGVRMLGPGYRVQRQFSNKLWFDNFLAEHRLPRPPSREFNYRRDGSLPFPGRNVLQVAHSTGGLGTFFVDSDAELQDLVRRKVVRRDRTYLARRFIEGTTYGIALFVSQDIVSLSALRRQCFFESDESGQKIFAGIQWVPTRDLPLPVQRRIDEVFLRFGRILHAQHYFGFANIDFLVDPHGEPLIIECNPRLSSASTQLFRFPELTGGVPVGRLFVENFFKARRYAARPRLVGLPESTYRGSVLQIMPKLEPSATHLRVERQLRDGLYVAGERALRFKGPDILDLGRDPAELLVLAYAKRGERYETKSSLGQILANSPLFTATGRVTRSGERLMERFNPAVAG